MKTIFAAVAVLSIALIATGGPVPIARADSAPSLDAFPKSTLQIATPDARLHRFNIWIAADDAHRERGLMFVKELPANTGMLFIYPAPRRVAMWMKNTLIPLDMIFVRADGRVSSIEANTKPHSLVNIESQEDVVAVLELQGGAAASLNIRKGAVLMHPLFGTAPKQ
jgi:uncharacterized protein